MCGILLLLRLAGAKNIKIDATGEFSDPLIPYLHNPYGVKPSQPHQSFWDSPITISPKMISADAIIQNMALRGPDLMQALCLELCPVTGSTLKRVLLGDGTTRLDRETMQVALDEFQLESMTPTIKAILVSSVLSLRPQSDGSASPQPVELNNGWLMYNGEVYSHEQWDGKGPDTPRIAELVLQSEGSTQELGRRTSTCVGEFAWITLQYLKTEHQDGWSVNWAKDPIGRRSLLLGKLENCQGIVLGSVNMLGFQHLHQASLENESSSVSKLPSMHQAILNPVEEQVKSSLQKLTKAEKVALHSKKTVNTATGPSEKQHAEELEESLEEKYLANYSTAKNSLLIEVPCNHLYSIRIEPALKVLQVEAVVVDKEYQTLLTDYGFSTAAPDLQPEARTALIAATKEQIKKALETSLGRIFDSLSPVTSSGVAAIILFSGGLDSTLITHLCQKRITAEDLLILKSVAFNPQAADKLTARRSYQQLAGIHGLHSPTLVEVCPEPTLAKDSEQKIFEMTYPQTSHLDVNIGRVLREAAGGAGTVWRPHASSSANEVGPLEAIPVQEWTGADLTANQAASRCRLVLCGQGADELFGGYRRYKQAFARGGATELKKEMRFDLGRLWVRNLGRDDRAIGSTSKEARFPFLDLELVKTLLRLEHPEILVGFGTKDAKIGEKVSLEVSEPQEKQLLRSLATDLGLTLAASFAKKAMQFGTGAAKVSNIAKFGSNRAAKGAAKYSLEQS